MTKTSALLNSARRASALFSRSRVRKTSPTRAQGALFLGFGRAGKALKNNAKMIRALHREPDSLDTDLNFKHYSEPIKELIFKKLGCITEGMKPPHLVMSCPTFKDSSELKNDEDSIVDVYWIHEKPKEGADVTSMFGFRFLFSDEGMVALNFLESKSLVAVKLESTKGGRNARIKDEERRMRQAKYGTGGTALINRARATVVPCAPLPLKPQRTDTMVIHNELARTVAHPCIPPSKDETDSSLSMMIGGLGIVEGIPTPPLLKRA